MKIEVLMKKLRRDCICVIAVFLLSAVFLSCSINAERKSLNSTFDRIDALINQRQYNDALKELEKAEKYAYDSWTKLGFYRRYRLISEDSRAERVLVSAIKKNPANQELLAVYSNFCMRKGRISDALSYGKSLRGTRYGSIYSEAVLRSAVEEKAQNHSSDDLYFLTKDYFPIFYDAWAGSKNPVWLRNSALLHLMNGNYSDAALIHPGESYSADDAYFWSEVMYDAARFEESADYAVRAARLYDSAPAKFRRRISLPEIFSLASDSHTLMKNSDAAEEFRQKILDSLADKDGSWVLTDLQKSKDFLQAVFTNSARYAENNGDDAKCASLLIFTVNTWEDYIPALATYADFALRSNTQRDEDYEQLQLRDEGLATLEMEKYDNRVKIPVQDAVHRIDKSLARTNSPLLFIIRLNLRYKIDKSLSEEDKRADLWKSLEQTQTAPSVYPELMFDFAESFLLQRKNYDEAFSIFYKYITAKYGFKPESFWESTVKNVQQFSANEAEYAAYFAANYLRANDALSLYEYCVFGNSVDGNRTISPAASDSECINLALIYNSLGRRNDALDLYSKCAGRAENLSTKSFVMYRMAKLYNSINDFKNARLSAEYALVLNPRNAEARLLLNKIKLSQ